MKRYIRAVICLIYTLVKFSILKLFHFKGFRFSLFNLISPFTEIEIGKSSELFLGRKVRMRSGSKVRTRKGAQIKIGCDTSLNHGCIVTAHEKILIGKSVQFGPNVVIYDHDHDFRVEDGLKNLKYKTSAVEIGDGTWIGANVVILRGTKIGKNCVVGAGSVLSGHNEYPDHSIIIQKRETEITHYNIN